MFKSAQTGYESYYQMLSDGVRMDAYREAIHKCVKPGDIVVDLGAGTGILGMWALQAGAGHVYAIEQTDAIDLAREIARANGYLDKMTFIQANSLDTELEQKADVLVSETLGSFAIDENLLQFMPDARRRFLKPGGCMLPSALRLYAAPVDAPQAWNKIDFWRQPQGGIDFSPAFELFSRKILIESIEPAQLLSEAAELETVDLVAWDDSAYQWRGYFPIQRKGVIHGMTGWFEAELAGKWLTTAPGRPATHWKQAFFPFREPIHVIRGDVLDWQISVAGVAAQADHTNISYQYRCTQTANEIITGKPGRNQPCPCGSGLKYKRCCGT